MGSNPTPGTYRIHTPFGRLILGFRQHEPKLQALLPLGEPRHRADRSREDLPLVLWIALTQHCSEIATALPQPPDRREGPDGLARSLCASKLVPDLSLLPLEIIHDLLDQGRVDPGGDAAQLRMLIRLDVGQSRFEPSPEGLFATTPKEGLLVTLQSGQAVRTEKLPIQDSNYLGLKAIVPDASLAARALPVPDGLLGSASPLDRGHPAAAVAEDHPPEGPGGPTGPRVVDLVRASPRLWGRVRRASDRRHGPKPCRIRRKDRPRFVRPEAANDV